MMRHICFYINFECIALSSILFLTLTTIRASASMTPGTVAQQDPSDEPAAGFFDQLDEEELPLPTQSFGINFLNHQLDYALISPKRCVDGESLLVFVPSRPEGFYTRQKIRESWGSNLTAVNAALRFSVGWPKQRGVFDLLLEEFFIYSDLILYDIEDSYANLYLKVYVSLQWQQNFCSKAHFVLKTDDDAVVDLERLRWWIDNDFAQRTVIHPASVFGGLWRGVKAIRSKKHKWYVSREEYPGRKYPAYMNGPTYLLTNKAISDIMNATSGIKSFPIEDILYTGVLASKVHVHKFSVWQHFRYGKYVYVHERCRNDPLEIGRRVPYVTAIYGISDPDNIGRAFQQLHSVNCTDSWSLVRRLIWNSLFSD